MGETESTTSRPEAEWQSGGLTIAELLTRFDARQLGSVTITDVPNRRLASDLACVRQLWSADDRQLVEDIRRSITADTDVGIDPEDFWKLSDAQPRDVRIRWSPYSANGHFDVELVARDRARGAPLRQRSTDAASASRRQRLATDPLEVAFMQQLGLELQQLLSDRLPESRLPATVLAVNELPSEQVAAFPDSAAHFPQEGNGRIDRRMVQR